MFPGSSVPDQPVGPPTQGAVPDAGRRPPLGLPPSFAIGGPGQTPDGSGRSGGRMALLAVGAFLLLAAGVAVFVGLRSGNDDGTAAVASSTSSGADNPASTVAPNAETPAEETAPVTVTGESLPAMPDLGGLTTADNDPAVGMVAPTLVGTDFAGNEVTITADGRPKVIYFLAHWCPHCQVELPTVQGLVDSGAQPDGMDIYAVSTAVSDGRGNFPPRDWFAAEGWSSPVLRDDLNNAAVFAYGAGGFPFVVYLDGENRVLARSAGELPADVIADAWAVTAG